MTQPPDERDPLAGDPPPAVPDPGVEPAPDDQATVAWTPEPPAGDAAAPTEDSDIAPPLTPDEPTAPASPIISASPATPTAPTTGWAQSGDTPPAPPIVGWEIPAPSAAAPATEGYVIAGVGARIVAYLIDSILVSIVPWLLSLFVLDYSDLISDSIDAARAGISTTMTIPITTEFVLVTLITIAIQYIYFVGFWTTGGRATPGMRGLRMQVVDAVSGQPMSVVAATKRWVLLGGPLGLLSLVEPLQQIAGILSLLLIVIVLLTAVTDDRKQGIHDRWANSLVIRNATSGDGATAIGCVVLVAMVIGLGIVVSLAALIAFGPLLLDIMSQVGQSI